MKMTFDEWLDARDNARQKREAKALDKQERLENKAEALVGELADGTFYINLTDRRGIPTGKIKKSTSQFELVQYLIRNGYVS